MKKLLRKALNVFKPSRTVGARAIIVQDDKILLVRHTYTNDWYTVGGGVEKGESTLEALIRELREEVGIVPTETPALFGIYHSTKEKRDDYVSLYVCKAFNKSSVSSLEIAEEKWFPIDNLPANVSPATRRRIEEYQGKRPVSDKW